MNLSEKPNDLEKPNEREKSADTDKLNSFEKIKQKKGLPLGIKSILDRRRSGGKLFADFSRAGAVEWLEQQSIPYRSLMSYYKCAMMEVETKFRVLNEEFSLQHDRNPIEVIKTRLKEPASLLEKLDRYNVPLRTDAIEEQIHDIAGVRVICSFPEDIYMLAECLLEQDDITLIEKKDYIQNPKPNGYRSLHLIVETPIFLVHQKKVMKVEIQLRTIAMDFWATLEHKLKYKKDVADEETLTRELKECADVSAALDLRMDEIRKKTEIENRKQK